MRVALVSRGRGGSPNLGVRVEIVVAGNVCVENELDRAALGGAKEHIDPEPPVVEEDLRAWGLGGTPGMYPRHL